MNRFPRRRRLRANRDLRRPEACEPVGRRQRTPWQMPDPCHREGASPQM